MIEKANISSKDPYCYIDDHPYVSFQSFPLSAGHVLGGGSTINWMLHVRGNRRDFDYWKALGNSGWSFKDVLPFFKKSENYTGTSYGKGGRWQIWENMVLVL